MEQEEYVIKAAYDHGIEWTVEIEGGQSKIVPQDSRNRDARAVLRWIDRGGQVQSREAGVRRAARQRLREDPLLRGLSRTLAQHFGMTPGDFREEWIDNVPLKQPE